MTSSSKKYVFIDYEFNQITENYVKLVCCSFRYTEDFITFSEIETYWLHKELREQVRLAERLEELHKEGFTFVAYSAEAEVRATLACNTTLKLWEWKWVDLWVEYRHLLNHSNDLKYGKQLQKNGSVKFIPVPKSKWDRKEGEKGSSDPLEGLAYACYKLLDVKIDTERKTKMRNLIISDPEEFTDDEAEEIMDYCESDIIYLPKLLKKMSSIYKRRLTISERKTLLSEMLSRGEYAARTAYMVTEGYPIDVEQTQGFSDSVPMILRELCIDINSQFEFKPFKWDRKDFKFKWRQKFTREFLREEYPEFIDKWMMTKGKDLSLSLEAFTRNFAFQHTYPRGNFGAQIVRYLKVKQSLNGFLPKPKDSDKKTFWDSVGSDGRVRPYFNIYRSQSARSQPGATGYLFLKSAWMRALCVPPKGYAMVGIDWASQEFLLGAIMSEDRAMLKAYQSGDPYFWFAKQAKAVPQDALRKDNEKIRDAFKATTLAEMYMMGLVSLRAKLSTDTGRQYTEEETEDLDDMFNSVFADFCEWRMDQVQIYYDEEKLQILDGWYMWGDNTNFRSIANCPIQGAGSAVMRKSVAFAQNKGLTVIKTLHDSLYILVKLDELHKIDELAEAMDDGFRYFFTGKNKALASCRLDANVWSPELEDCEWVTAGGVPVKQQSIYVDKRAIEDYNKFSKYFRTSEVEKLL